MAVAGCATTPPADYPKLVEKRAGERWGQLLKGNVDAAYEYLSPATRATLTREQYKGSIRPGLWREARIVAVECEADVCRAMVEVVYDHRLIKGVRTQINENWLIRDGNAWFVHRG